MLAGAWPTEAGLGLEPKAGLRSFTLRGPSGHVLLVPMAKARRPRSTSRTHFKLLLMLCPRTLSWGKAGPTGSPELKGGGSMLYKEMLSPASRGCGDGVRRRTGGPGRSVCLVLYSASTTQSWQHLLRRSFPCWRRSHHSWRPHEGSGRPPPQPRSALQTPRSRTRVYWKPASRLRQTRRIRRTEPLTRFHSVSLSN